MSLVHLHLALTHVPVIGLLAVLGLFVWAYVRRNSEVARAAFAGLILVACVTGLVFLTGEPAEEAVEKLAGVTEDSIDEHKELAEAALVATLALGTLAVFAFVGYLKREIPRLTMAIAFTMTLIVCSLMGVVANAGGQIRHTEIAGSVTPGNESRGERDGH